MLENILIFYFSTARKGTVTEVVVRRCSVKKVFFKLYKLHKKTPVPESVFNKGAGLRPAI